MSGDFGVVFHLWDFADEAGTTLDRVLGEVAPDHLTVPAVTGPVERLRLNPARAPHTFVTEGGWHFPPGPDSYKSGSVRPRPARWTGKRDMLARLRDHAGSRNVKLVFRVDLRALTSLPEHEPHLRPRNAWGDENPAAGICALNADARELLRGTLADLLRYEPAGFQLVDWMADLVVSRGPGRQFSWNPLLRQLLDICFCPACRQAADVDPDQAARSVRVHAERMITDGDEYDAAGRLDADETLRAYIDARRRDVLTWLERLAGLHEQCKHYMLTDRWFDADHWLQAEAAFANLPYGTITPVCRSSSSPLRDIDLQRDFVEPAAERQVESFGLILPVWYPFVRQADELVRTVSAAGKAGIAPIDFEGLEQAPGEAIDWLRQAVRFARRG
ncbi:MAG: hypothetical protein KKI02_10960 [Planctomycetes bacterium]|nr:hypothetical protein [Planctomycetota bacterium]